MPETLEACLYKGKLTVKGRQGSKQPIILEQTIRNGGGERRQMQTMKATNDMVNNWKLRK